MKLSELVSSKIDNKPPRIVLHGVHGIGKSTWASGSPSPIFLQTEDGLTNIEVPHFPLCEKLEDVWSYLSMLIKEDHDYKTIVVDSADWLERLIFKEVCVDNKVKSIEGIGYGKGYTFAMAHWERFFSGLNMLRDKGLIVVILAHNEAKTYDPPDGDAYTRWQIKLHKLAAAKLEEWADVVAFAGFKTFVDSDTGKVINSSAERVVYTCNRPAWRAKSRYNLPDEMPLDFPFLLTAIKGSKKVSTTSSQSSTKAAKTAQTVADATIEKES